MADYVEKWGDDVESAIELALKDLKLTRDEITYTVLEEPSKGFLGLFNKKLAKVRVEKKVENKEFKRSVEKSPAPEKEKYSYKSSVKIEKNDVANDLDKKDISVKSMAEPFDLKSEDNFKKPAKSFAVMGTKFSVSVDESGVTDGSSEPAVAFISQIAEDMGLNVKIDASILEDVLYLNLSGNDVGTMIGKRGQTLDAIQYLASIVENKNRDKHLRVIVNAESYREKREKTLQQLAKRLAEKCVWSGHNVRLEPMNPYERKVIHSTLQSNPKVNTRSEGVEPNRRVIIENAKGIRRK